MMFTEDGMMKVTAVKNSITRKSITLMCVLMLGLFAGNAFAQSLEEAKSAGLIGEKSDGYIGLVQSNAPAAVVALVNDVNRQRRARYEQIARENGITVQDVAQVAYLRAVEATRSGHFVEDASGRWVRKP
jgi:uncharacterized protein